jgi:hypothetical protein
MSLTTVHVECSLARTPLVAVGSAQPGLVTYTLDPEHFSQVAADGIEAVLDTMATNGSWRYRGQNRKFPTEYEVRRNLERCSGAPVVYRNDPGWTAISVDAEEMTDVGRAALEGAILTQMAGWEQTPILT